MAFAGAHLPHNGVGAVSVPVDRAIALGHQWARPTPRRPCERTALLQRHAVAIEHPLDRLDERFDRPVPGLMPVEAALADAPHREVACRPHTAGIGLTVGLEHHHPPVAFAEFDRPIQRGRSPVAGWTAGARSDSGALTRSARGSSASETGTRAVADRAREPPPPWRRPSRRPRRPPRDRVRSKRSTPAG
jgi:hypothetical protein